MFLKDLTDKIINSVPAETLRTCIDNLSNKIEELSYKIVERDKKIQQLEAQIRKMQGLPAKPVFANKDKISELDKEDDHNDEGNGSNGNGKNKKRSDAAKKPRRKKKDLPIDKIKKVAVDPGLLDSNFKNKGYREVVVQDLFFHRNNIKFLLERFYNPETGKMIEAKLPQGFRGAYFGANLIAFIKHQYYEGDVTIKKIYKILKSIDIQISIKQINKIINDCPDELTQELESAVTAGIEKANYQQIDDTNTKLLGVKSLFTIVTCNEFFTRLFSTISKSRSRAVMALSRAERPVYKLNNHAFFVICQSKKSLKLQSTIESLISERVYEEEEVNELLESDEFSKFKPPTLRGIKTAMLVGAFYDRELGYPGEALVSDDAPQFNYLYDDHLLCWYHEFRHYKELNPVVGSHIEKLKMFFSEAKQLYRALKRWQELRTDELRNYLLNWFDELFKEKTGYRALDNRKKLTLKKMKKLLTPLFSSVNLPLTNNESERDLRGRKIKSKISLFDRTWEGVKARDLYISLKQTCRKNGVSFYQYLLDREIGSNQIPQLSEIIRAR